MNLFAFLFFLANAAALLWLPRRWAPVPLLIGCCYMTTGQGLEIGAVSLPMIRLLLVVGLIRTVMRGERISGPFNIVDRMVVALAGWMMLASFFHQGEGAGTLFSAGIVLNFGAVYYLIRVFCRSWEDVYGLAKVTAFLLVPIVVEMMFEKMTGKNLFAMLFGGVSEDVVMREGRLRARGPFRHSILAGTIGAVSVPLMVMLWRRHPKLALIGVISGVVMIFASASTGPIASLAVACAALALWRYKTWTAYLPLLALFAYGALAVVMNRPAYFIISKVDLVGGSTGWHRAKLIDSSIEHLNEWWLFGTDYTRHWMPTGITWSNDHTDITNYYLQFGVWAGLPALLLFAAIAWKSLVFMFRTARMRGLPRADRYAAWCLGAAMASHAATSISVAYYDQSFVFYWFTVAVIGSCYGAAVRTRRRSPSAEAIRDAKPVGGTGAPAPVAG